jgi:hypothetical protein
MIQQQLTFCYDSIAESERIEFAWQALTVELGWSAVMASKTLHFLCRALGNEDDVPVPIDNAVVRTRVWRAFVKNCATGTRPEGWCGDELDAYLRYMTAIRSWAASRQWTTTQMESTLFSHFGHIL